MSFENPYVTTDSILGVDNGGTGITSFTDGELLIGKTDGTLNKSTITAGDGITITNGDGTVTIASAVSGGGLTAENIYIIREEGNTSQKSSLLKIFTKYGH